MSPRSEITDLVDQGIEKSSKSDQEIGIILRS